ncbi:MAG: hypothetical protein J4400_02750 [Candidatus Aenigmarchaeota archaeon]|nr:hypothetical protein [Candidatus Aenigmarchaeota archaeon]
MNSSNDDHKISLIETLPFHQRIAPLMENPQLGTLQLPRPFRYKTPSPDRRNGFRSNCCGTAAYIFGLEDSVEFYFQTDETESFSNIGYIAFPQANRPGYIEPELMGRFLRHSDSIRPIDRKPLAGDMITFHRAGNRKIIHAAVYLGPMNGSEWIFCQYDWGEPFGFSTIEGFVGEESYPRDGRVLFDFYQMGLLDSAKSA